MVEILSETETEMLAQNLIGPSTQTEATANRRRERRISPYDFRHPNRLSKDQMRTLQIIHEHFAKATSSYLASTLRTLVDGQLLSVLQVTYGDFVSSLTDPSCYYVFHIGRCGADAVLEINPSIAFLVVDRLFGGIGRAIQANREVTTIEQKVMTKVAESILKNLDKAWEHLFNLDLTMKSFLTRPSFVQIAAPGETAIAVTVGVQTQGVKSMIKVCYPFMALEEVLPQLSINHMVSSTGKQRPNQTSDLWHRQLQQTMLPVVVTLGEATMTVEELMQLREGDVLRLNRLVEGLVEVRVGGRWKFSGKPGRVQQRRAVQILDIIDEPLGR